MTEHKNPIDQCASLNPLVLPEYCLHMLSTLLFLCVGEWFSLTINIPLIAYHVYRYLHRPVMSVPGLYDPTTILNMDMIKRSHFISFLPRHYKSISLSVLLLIFENVILGI